MLWLIISFTRLRRDVLMHSVLKTSLSHEVSITDSFKKITIASGSFAVVDRNGLDIWCNNLVKSYSDFTCVERTREVIREYAEYDYRTIRRNVEDIILGVDSFTTSQLKGTFAKMREGIAKEFGPPGRQKHYVGCLTNLLENLECFVSSITLPSSMMMSIHRDLESVLHPFKDLIPNMIIPDRENFNVMNANVSILEYEREVNFLLEYIDVLEDLVALAIKNNLELYTFTGLRLTQWNFDRAILIAKQLRNASADLEALLLIENS